MNIDLVVKAVAGVSSLAVGWGSKKIITACKEAGYDVPDWVEELAPGALGLAANLGMGRYINGPQTAQRNDGS